MATHYQKHIILNDGWIRIVEEWLPLGERIIWRCVPHCPSRPSPSGVAAVRRGAEVGRHGHLYTPGGAAIGGCQGAA